MSSPQVNQYLRVLGLKPGATLQQISSRYFFYLKQLPEDPSPEQEEMKRRLQHAYNILRRAYASQEPARPKRRKKRPAASRSTAIMVGVGSLLLVGIAVFAAMNFSSIQIRMKEYEAGDTVRWKDSGEPYGKVMRFEADHNFSIGEPSPAYEIQLDGTTDTVWVSERIVEKAMVPVGSD